MAPDLMSSPRTKVASDPPQIHSLQSVTVIRVICCSKSRPTPDVGEAWTHEYLLSTQHFLSILSSSP